MAKESEHRQRFERQRRNLIGLSVGMLFYLSMGIELEKVNILGNVFQIDQPLYLEYWLWIALIYFFIRYYQYWKVVDSSEFMLSFHESMQKYVRQIAARKFKAMDPFSLNDRDDGYKYQYDLEDIDVIKSYPWEWELRISGHIDYRSSEDGQGVESFGPEPYKMVGRQLLWPKIRSFAHLWCETPQITEYKLPVALAVGVVCFKIYILVWPFS